MSGGSRTAFQLWPALEHKGKQSVISAIALDDTAQHIYLGTSDGQLEEHRIHSSNQGIRVSLGARKHIGKKPVTALHYIAGVDRLAAVCDGNLLLLDPESLKEWHMPGAKGVTAITVNVATSPAPWLAAAHRVSKRTVRVTVYELIPGISLASGMHAPPAQQIYQADLTEPLLVKGMVWLGQSLVMATSLRYVLFDPRTKACTELFSVSPEAPPPTMVQAVPSADEAILLMDQVGIVTDSRGHPTHSALAFPTTPSALAVSGIYVLAACADGLYAYDRATSAWVQSLPYPGGVRTAPGQQLSSAQNASGSCILIAGYRKVWMLQPIALEEQARELLKAGNFDQALQLADVAAAEGAPWVEEVYAEAALLLIHELRFREAVDALLRCSTTIFQPGELFPLFPQYTQPWAARKLHARAHWGICPPLTDLHTLIERLEQSESDGQHKLSENGDAGVHYRMAAAARQCVADYLLEVRHWEGAEALDGIDTLLVHLLADADSAAALESFAAAPNEARADPTVRLELVEEALRERKRFHALALLCSNSGASAKALTLWQAIAEGTLQEAAADDGEVKQALGNGSFRGVAVHHATALLLDEARVPPDMALRFLPWLLAAYPADTLAVLKGRALPAEQVLPLLRKQAGELCCQYLEYLVVGRGSQVPEHHTELALSFASAALALMPPVDESVPAWKRALAARERMSEDTEEAQRLRHLRDRLCMLLEDSDFCDACHVLEQIASTELWDEQVILHSKLGDHRAALRILALTLGDIRLAEAYCARFTGREGHLLLLDLLLHPGDERPPLYIEACHLLAAQGAELDATKVLDALSEEMPLSVAVDIIARMLRTAIHARRSASIVRNLHRSLHLSNAAERAELMQRRVVVTEERACSVCHMRISTKMFAVYPNGVLVCFKCYRKGDPSICPVSGRDFRL